MFGSKEDKQVEEGSGTRQGGAGDLSPQCGVTFSGTVGGGGLGLWHSSEKTLDCGVRPQITLLYHCTRSVSLCISPPPPPPPPPPPLSHPIHLPPPSLSLSLYIFL